ncbi:hypothetical protein [Vibrio caribbeanicus]|uniref:Uncharacterized protein n=1 Tax=Vibrio caribbeanicus ATCC BAA-2122 TaxID=796620 RepID=E3BMN0_9VIBR|nr:hypothetical protein [Vibrio caribbeanicus]EFP95775.1 hypothetical protein VIBC2010_17530 [Vibrio caribbeanicus ATCC BAA-2122]
MKLRLIVLGILALLISTMALSGSLSPRAKIHKDNSLKRAVTVNLKYVVPPRCTLDVIGDTGNLHFKDAGNVKIKVSSNFSGKTELSLKDDGAGIWTSDSVNIPYKVQLHLLSDKSNNQAKFTENNFAPAERIYGLKADVITSQLPGQEVPEGEYLAPVVIELNCST